MPEKASGEPVGELSMGIVRFHEVQKARKAALVNPGEVRLAEALGELAEVRTASNLLNQLLGRGVVVLEPV